MEQLFINTSEYKRLCAGLEKPGVTALFGLPPVGRAQVLALLSRKLGRPLIVVTAGEAEATRFAEDLCALGRRAEVFPARDFVLRPVEGTGREYEYRRLAVLGSMVGGRLDAVCVPAEGLLQYTVPKEEFCRNTLTLKPGLEIPQKELVKRLSDAGYVRRDQVEGPGQFSVRGGIVDVYTPDQKAPSRMEFWGDEIDTLASFDLMTQRRTDNLEKLHISPAREVLFGDAAETAAALRRALENAPARRRKALAEAMEGDLAQLDAGLVPEALDKYLGIRYPKPGTLLEYFESPLLALEEPGGIREAQRATQYRRDEELKGLFEEKILCPGLDVLYMDMDWLNGQAQKCPTLACENFARTLPDLKLRDLLDLPCHPLPSWGGEVAALMEDLQPLLQQGYAVTLMAGTEKGAAALAKDLAARGVRASASKDLVPSPGAVCVQPGHLTGGVQFPFARFALITGRSRGSSEGEKKKRKKNKDALASLTDVTPGDYVVHQNHGIGIYAGIRRLDLQGVVKDYLKITYAKGDTLYVPVTQLDLLSRYTAPGDGENVKLSRLGGAEWTRAKSKARSAAQEIAQELVELYARRQQAKGFAFPEDGDWQRDFETRFEYDETEDQLVAAFEIKQDMEKACPMDRLLCGDVGVGKTEVALRAAFKCVMGGKQCAILAPTTLLAWQHYNTALARMEAFQFDIGLLSRFRTAKQQQATLKGLAAGSVDVVVGTHRLLSQDVKFKNLGLVIIDEEQRFGVKHKEKLKEAFIGVDMLTLSATPIPRTLNMAMTGIRDMSTIEEPPFERQPIETYVMEYDDNIVAEALKK
ncbi:MAG: DEAD/DEAH box helicase, partial [Oscillospiraceae bacterium]|nr:DEAD/DEAH box helicase [Oscillospiraceae bacterium]